MTRLSDVLNHRRQAAGQPSSLPRANRARTGITAPVAQYGSSMGWLHANAWPAPLSTQGIASGTMCKPLGAKVRAAVASHIMQSVCIIGHAPVHVVVATVCLLCLLGPAWSVASACGYGGCLRRL
ncbi:hypothetical protein HaLaN_26440 [Haematococcus lacustris]|uniref:Uncharacterized protein n=1 Tax=Haematococcus lacustris TaxID=44745 RepID=A0A6A0A6L9_HAELA|nr:hypothetical protein HaLaN_26440 [Haematococcus lacustris]